MDVYNYNFCTTYEPSDVREVRFEDIARKRYRRSHSRISLPRIFSILGPRNGLESERGQLYKEIRRALDSLNPKVFMAENVQG